jgi:hypothetical protein
MAGNEQSQAGTHQPSVARPGPYPPAHEIRLYYKTVLGADRVPDKQPEIINGQCPFKPHNNTLYVDLRDGRWRCSHGCGEGDIYTFEMRRKQGDHFRRCKESVLETIARATEEQSGPDSNAKDNSETPLGGPSFVDIDIRRLVTAIGRHPGASRRYHQQNSHWLAKRFNRAIDRIERRHLVSWVDEASNTGRRRRIYYPLGAVPQRVVRYRFVTRPKVLQ